MSVAAFQMPTRTGGQRWLLLGSLALNLFFIGVAAAMAIRGPAPPSRWDPDVFVRVERLASALPPADADLLRGAFQVDHEKIADAQSAYYGARRDIHETLRQDPFNVDEMRAAMAKMRAARQDYDQVIQGVFAGAAVKMSSAARHAVADWRPDNSSKRNRQ
ncbi:MAG TPA: periplasmic heavy metal sensor [Pseudolabrys sp.]|nr:periplasmic heavy metal sensor [Pseudolabrys sp.]